MPRKYYRKKMKPRKNKAWKMLRKAWGGTGTRLSMFSGTGLPSKLSVTLCLHQSFSMSSNGTRGPAIAQVAAGTCRTPWVVPPSTREPQYFSIYKQIYNDMYISASKVVIKCVLENPNDNTAQGPDVFPYALSGLVSCCPVRGLTLSGTTPTDIERPRGRYRLVSFYNPSNRLVNYAKTSAILTSREYRKPQRTDIPPDDVQDIWAWNIQLDKLDKADPGFNPPDNNIVYAAVSVEVYYRVHFSERRVFSNPPPAPGPA